MSWDDLKTGSLLASNAVGAYNKILQLGLLRIQLEMANAKTYVHDKPAGIYDDKNTYFNGANFIGYSLLKQNATGFSKMYYWTLLNAITTYEINVKKPLNKGMVCGNLAVSSLAEGDIDGGIAYMLWAEEEDRFYSGKPELSVYKNSLYGQYSKGETRNGLSQFGIPAPWVQIESFIKQYNVTFSDNVKISDFLKELETSKEHRSLFEGSVWVIHRNLALLREENNLRIYVDKNNLYTRLRLYDGIIGLCRFIELRMKAIRGIEGTLGNVLSDIFTNEPWLVSIRDICSLPKENSPTNAEEFDRCIRFAFEDLKDHERSIYILWIFRNYSAHVCDPNTPYVFQNFEKVFAEILFAYIYFLKKEQLV